MKNLHLVCNAHLDLVWMWEIEEGIAETLSTFRIAADFCDKYDGFVFNHNESILYKWVEEYDEELFERIKNLVAEKKWHIMGGWYLQPDCNMPSGESFVRQILSGKQYFMEKFNVEPTTAINFDAFGHTRGLVEILKKANYDSYIFCRPEPDMLDLPAEDFLWEGFCGSTIMMQRAYNSYESHRGEADEKIKGWMDLNGENQTGLVLWGIGNHGGGPSEIDLNKIEELAKNEKEWKIIHSTPEAYFNELKPNKDSMPVYDKTLNPRYTGCYTSQIRIKMQHRKLENELYLTEKMVSQGASNGLVDYPSEALDKAQEDLMMIQFHDILPGSAIPEVERYSLDLAGHALEELKRQKIKTFIALCADQEKAEDDFIPIMAYNPHPFKVKGIFHCEFQMPDQNKNRDLFGMPVVYRNGEKIPCQTEHESSNFNVDWRKKSVFYAELEPNSVNRFDVQIEMIPQKPDIELKIEKDFINFDNGDMKVRINTKTGAMDKYERDGFNYIKGDAFLPIVVNDDENSWAHKEKSFRDYAGKFQVMDREEGSDFSGILEKDIDSVRIIEDGEVRSIVEVVMKYNNSFIAQRYYLPKQGTEIKITTKVYWNEKMKMLKMSIPTSLGDADYIGQTAYGHENLSTNGDEMVSQRWNMVTDGQRAVTIINNGTYGSDCLDGEARITMLRSPGYSAGKSDFSVRDPYIMPQDRFSPYIDQGEHDYEFYFNGGKAEERTAFIEREANIISEQPMLLSFFPSGEGKDINVKAFVELEDESIVVPTIKLAGEKDRYVIRLFNPLTVEKQFEVSLPIIDKTFNCKLAGLEFKTFAVELKTGDIYETDLLERRI